MVYAPGRRVLTNQISMLTSVLKCIIQNATIGIPADNQAVGNLPPGNDDN